MLNMNESKIRVLPILHRSMDLSFNNLIAEMPIVGLVFQWSYSLEYSFFFINLGEGSRRADDEAATRG